MPIKYYLKTGGLIALTFFVLALISIHFIDKPLALFIHSQGISQWHQLSIISENEIIATIVFSLLILAIFPMEKQLRYRIAFILYAAVICYLVSYIRQKLGSMCARSWPNTWPGSGIYGSLTGDGQFGFHFFQTNSWKGSFPSGHSAAITYICSMMFLAYRQFNYKYWWWAPVLVMVICQVLQNFHFLGDCLAGVALGILMSYWAFAVYIGLRHRK